MWYGAAAPIELFGPTATWDSGYFQQEIEAVAS
jgi:hypothetical protein